MKKRTADKFWFPWWPDKWIFGSVRIECTPAERGIWVDLLSLASKDDGHIRANEETPYPLDQLAGMLIIPLDDLVAAIAKFITVKDKDGNSKLTRLPSGTLYITKWDKYQFSDRHKRRIEGEMSGKTDMVSDHEDAILNKSTLKNNKLNNKKEEKNIPKKDELVYLKEFKKVWKMWKKEEPFDGTTAKEKFLARCKEGLLDEILAGISGYINHINNTRKEGFEQRVMYLSTFLTKRKERWKEFMGIKEKRNL